MSALQQTLSQLRGLRLSTMAEAYEQQVASVGSPELSFDERFGLLVQAEASSRSSRALSKIVRDAQIPELACLEDVDYKSPRSLDKALLARLGTCDWIRSSVNAIIVGQTGLGKTWLGCALAHESCRRRITTRFWKVADLCDEITTAGLDGSLSSLRASLVKPGLLVLDDLGVGTISSEVADFLFRVIDARQKTGSLLITSQYPIDQWHGLFPDPTVSDAILDRVVHKAHIIELKGESMRKALGRAALQQPAQSRDEGGAPQRAKRT